MWVNQIAEDDALRREAGERKRAYTGWLGDFGPPHTHTVREGALLDGGSEGETEEETKQIPAHDESRAELNSFETSETCGAKEQRDRDRGEEVEDVEGGTAERKDSPVEENREGEPCGQSLRENSPIIPGETTEAHGDAPDQSLGGDPGSPLLSGGARSSASATPLSRAATALGSSIITTVSGRRSMSSGASGTAIRDRSLSPSERANVDIDGAAESDGSFGNSAGGSPLGVQEVDHVATPIDADFEAYLQLAVDDVVDSAGFDEGACVTGEGSTGGGGGSPTEGGMPAPGSGDRSDRSAADHTGPTTGSWWKHDTSTIMGPIEALDDQQG